MLFAILMALPALPLPTGGATHVLEIVTALLALELVAGRRTIWLPQRFRRIELGDKTLARLRTTFLRRVRRLERFSRPRWRWLFDHVAFRVVYGAIVFAFTVTAFVAPPFSGLDTLPSLGVVALSLGVLINDAALALVGVIIGALGVVSVTLLGSIVLHAIRSLF